MNFQELNLREELNLALKNAGYEVPTAIQKAAIPLLLEKKDILGKSHTGTGKTAAFVLPILHHLDEKLKHGQAIIICPTRELALQVSNQIHKYGKYIVAAKVALLTGGVSINYQLKMLRTSNIIVGTPGRIIDHLRRKSLRLNYINTVVLDEADEMLKMGFKDDIELIFSKISKSAQKVFFSATISELIKKIADNYQNNPIMINTNDEKTPNTVAKITQYYYETKREKKSAALINIYQKVNPNLSIVFTNTKSESLLVYNALKAININCAVINGDKRQREREKTMQAFRLQKVKVLVATDVLARGIDVKDVDYVFNYDVPQYQDSYLHRIGRTGRAGSTGIAITLINNYNDLRNFRHIQQKLRLKAIPFPLHGNKK